MNLVSVPDYDCRLPDPRTKILRDYSRWTALSALRSGSPIRARRDLYPLLDRISFDFVLDVSLGPITQKQFNSWHRRTVMRIANSPKMDGAVGWSAKIVNIYLKTYCYVGAGGRSGLVEVMHPPIDSGLWKGVKSRFGDRAKIIDLVFTENTIREITTYRIYSRIIRGFREIAEIEKCHLIEVDALWVGASWPKRGRYS